MVRSSAKTRPVSRLRLRSPGASSLCWSIVQVRSKTLTHFALAARGLAWPHHAAAGSTTGPCAAASGPRPDHRADTRAWRRSGLCAPRFVSVSGGDLAQHLRRHGPLGEASCRYLLRHLAAGLRVLRQHSIVHVRGQGWGRCAPVCTGGHQGRASSWASGVRTCLLAGSFIWDCGSGLAAASPIVRVSARHQSFLAPSLWDSSPSRGT